MSNRHRHADLIHAWAEGAEIEYRTMGGSWVNTKFSDCVTWAEGCEYRIKPEKKPDVVKRYFHEDGAYKECLSDCRYGDSFSLTFCGETGKLIKAEIL